MTDVSSPNSNTPFLGVNFTLYLAGPVSWIDNARTWREEAKKFFSDSGFTGHFLDPMRGETVDSGVTSGVFTDAEVVARCMNDARNCDIMLVYLPPTRTIGTPMEILEAANAGVPIYVVSDDGNIRKHPFILKYTLRVFCTLEEAAAHIMRVIPLWVKRRR